MDDDINRACIIHDGTLQCACIHTLKMCTKMELFLIMMWYLQPGLAFFYGGLVPRKSVLTIMMQVFDCLCLNTAKYVFEQLNYDYSTVFSA